MSLHDPCPWLMSMRDVMVDLKRLHAGVVRDVMKDCDVVHTNSSSCQHLVPPLFQFVTDNISNIIAGYRTYTVIVIEWLSLFVLSQLEPVLH